MGEKCCYKTSTPTPTSNCYDTQGYYCSGNDRRYRYSNCNTVDASGCNSNQQCINGNCVTRETNCDNRCTTTNKCVDGQGDCNSNSDCVGNLVCCYDVGSKFSCSSSIDICLNYDTCEIIKNEEPDYTPSSNDIIINIYPGFNQISKPSDNLIHADNCRIDINEYNTNTENFYTRKNVKLEEINTFSVEKGYMIFNHENHVCKLVYRGKLGFNKIISKGKHLLPGNILFNRNCKFGEIYFIVSKVFGKPDYNDKTGLGEIGKSYWVYSSNDENNCRISR